MTNVSLSQPRLERMHQVLSGYVERRDMPGLVALVSHHDHVHVETLGTLSFGRPAPMKRDTIFRIASLSKPITAVAAMILVEECKCSPIFGRWRMERSSKGRLQAVGYRTRGRSGICENSEALVEATEFSRTQLQHGR